MVPGGVRGRRCGGKSEHDEDGKEEAERSRTETVGEAVTEELTTLRFYSPSVRVPTHIIVTRAVSEDKLSVRVET